MARCRLRAVDARGPLGLGLVVTLAGDEQSESYRIIYAHVPSAWMSMSVYTVMALSSVVFLIWPLELTDVAASAAPAPTGAAFTPIPLTTDSLRVASEVRATHVEHYLPPAVPETLGRPGRTPGTAASFGSAPTLDP